MPTISSHHQTPPETVRDKALRTRVRLLGEILGKVVRSQAGEEVFAAVETLRRGHVRLRVKDDHRLRMRLAKLTAGLEPDALNNVVRAFNVYFQLVNIAEEASQHKQRRDIIRRGTNVWAGSFANTIQEFRQGGVSAQELQRLLGYIRYEPVFTAHPTESKRRTIMNSLRRIFLTSETLNNSRLGKIGKQDTLKELETQIQILWNTDEVRAKKLRVRDEIRNGLFYFRECLFQAVPETYRFLEKALQKNYGKKDLIESPVQTPTLIQFGSWIGGDRDGNPNVKPKTTVLALRLQMREILEEYMRRANSLKHELTHSITLCTPTQEFLARLDQDEKDCHLSLREHRDQFLNEPYRRKLHIMSHRLDHNVRAVNRLIDGRKNRGLVDGYVSEEDFLNDLRLIRDSLISHGDANVANGNLQDLVRLAETFGFYLMRLDIRQESSCHSAAIADLCKHSQIDRDYLALDEEARMGLLGDLISAEELPALEYSALKPMTRETLEVFGIMAQMRSEVSAKAFGQYVISMTHEASHIMEVMALARFTGLVGQHNDQWVCNIHVSPLFETIEDLAEVEAVLTKLLENPTYRNLLTTSGNVQEIMLGYSDSCKDGGIVAAGWNLYQAQKTIIRIADEHGVECRMFHGRGGTIGRGGGPTHEALLSQPAGTVHGQVKFTEQGEVLSYKYSNPETAVYELSMGVTGLMKASRFMIEKPPVDRQDFLGIMDELASFGEQAYRELAEGTDGFLDYFYEATPVREIGLMNIGSRPSHRAKQDRSRESIRAIPWVFGWAQSRHTLPAWYGIGYALEKWRNEDPLRLAKLQTMFQQWPFFKALLSNTQMALVKAEMDIAREYADLAENQKLADNIYKKIHDEFHRTVTQVLNIADAKFLMQETPELALSLSRRNPYLDPLNLIQTTLLARYRDENLSEEERAAWLRPLLRSINGIAAGMRNTG